MNLIDFLKSYGVLISVCIAIVVFLLNQWITKRRAAKELSCRVLRHVPLLSSAAAEVDSALLLLGGKWPAVEVSFLEVEILNSGAVAIKASDFVETFRLLAPEGAEFLEATVTRTSDRTFRPSITLAPGSVDLVPILVNRGDALIARILAAGLREDLVLDGRIEGASPVRLTLTPRNWFFRNLQRISQAILWPSVVLNGVLIGWSILTGSHVPSTLSWTLNGIIYAAASLSLWSTILTVRKNKKTMRENERRRQKMLDDSMQRLEKSKQDFARWQEERDEAQRIHEEEIAKVKEQRILIEQKRLRPPHEDLNH